MPRKLTTHTLLFLTAIGLSVAVNGQLQKQTISSLLLSCKDQDGLHLLEAFTNKSGSWRMEKDSVIAIIKAIESPSIKKSLQDFISLYDHDEYLPLKFGRRPFLFEYENENGTVGLAFTGIVTGKTYNNLKLDAKQRAQRAIDEVLYDFLRESYPTIDKNDYESIAVHIMYLTNDFASNKDYNLEKEAVVISVDEGTIKQFIDNKITDQQLIQKANIYLLSSESENYRKTAL